MSGKLRADRVPWLALIVVVGVNCAALNYLCVDWTMQFRILAVLLVLTLAGAPVAWGLRRTVNDPIVLAASAFWTGTLAYTFLCFVLFHRVVYHALGWKTVAACPQLALAVMLIPAAWGLWILLRRQGIPRPMVLAAEQRPAVVLAATLALLMSVATVYGVFNNATDMPHLTEPGVRDSTWTWPPLTLDHVSAEDRLRTSKIPDWGSNGDYLVHLVGLPAEFYVQGLPTHVAGHFGVNVLHLGLGLTAASYDEALVTRSAKVVSWFVWFSLFYCAGFYARTLFGLRRPLSWLVQLGFAFFAPVNWPPLRTNLSSYLGLVNSSGTLYHNITQLYSLTIGLTGVLLAGLAIKRREADWSFVVGCALGAGSFFFKPSFYTIFAPAVVLMYPRFRRWLKWQGIAGLAIILAPAAMWKLYPLLFPVDMLHVKCSIAPFGVLYMYAKLRFPLWLFGQKVLAIKVVFATLVVLAILALSFAAFVLPGIEYAVRLVKALRPRGPRFLMVFLRMRPLDVFVLVMFAAGMLSGLLLTENGGRAGHCNFLWATACGYLLMLPALLRLIVRSRSAIVRSVSWLAMPLHFWAGIVHLYIYVVWGTLGKHL